MFFSFPQNSPFKPPTPNSGVLKPTHIYLIIKKKLIGNLFIFSLFRNFLGSSKPMGFSTTWSVPLMAQKLLSRSTTTFQTLLGRICPRWRKLPRSTLGEKPTDPVGNQPGPNQPETADFFFRMNKDSSVFFGGVVFAKWISRKIIRLVLGFRFANILFSHPNWRSKF